MLPPAIHIDASDFINQSALSPEEIGSFKTLLLNKLGSGFNEQWLNQVNQTLHSTRPEYMRGMFVSTPDENTIVMGVTARKSKLAVDIELGRDAFDEKQGFEQSGKRTMKKDGKGWFLTIPFRHSVPTALGESSAFSSVMPVSVYRLARQATGGLKLRQLPSDMQVKTIRPKITSGGKTYPAYKHKSAKYEGLIRIADKDQARAQYMTFRRVSDLSDPNSWIHPGFLPYNLLGKALSATDVPSIVRSAKIEFFKNNR
jgi:hypothetical protein